MTTRTTLFFGMILLLNSCLIYETSIESNVDKTQEINLKKVNLVVEGNIETIRFLDSLSSLIADDFKRYGIEVQKTVKHPLELKSPEAFQEDYEKMLADFQPDAIFTIVEENMSTRYEESRLGKRMSATDTYTDATFIMSIGELEKSSKLWRASMTLKSGGDFEKLTKTDLQDTNRKVLKKLIDDNVLK